MIELRAILVVAAGAALGGVLRLLVTQAVIARADTSAAPLATFAINVSGSLLIGVVIGAAQTRPEISPLWRLFLATGILGGFTTFSSFSLEALTLATGGAAAVAVAYALGSVGLGIAAAYVGTLLARLV